MSGLIEHDVIALIEHRVPHAAKFVAKVSGASPRDNLREFA